MMGTRGPQPLGNTALIKIGVTPEIDAALSHLVTVSGVSKASLIRDMLARSLAQMGMLPGFVTDVAPTVTRGPDLAINRKEYHS
jgi:hypothetical protein